MALWSPDGRTQMSGFPGGAPKINPSGQAQPVQPQSQGTPYGSPTKPPPAGMVYNKAPSGQAGNFSAYAPQQQQSNPFAQYNPQQAGNFVQQQMGLPSFQFTATDSFGNTYDNPAALTAQQGAMAQALNAQRAQQIQSGNLGPLNPMAAYQQAQNMVQGGWTNPFAPGQARPVQPQSQGTPYGALGNIGTSLETHGTIGLGSSWRWRDNSAPQTPAPPGPDAYYPGDVFFPPRPGQAQPIPPPSPGTQYGQPATDPVQPPSRRLAVAAAKEPTPSPPKIQQGYAIGSMEHNEAAYKELLQQIRVSGGATAAQERRKRDLERRLGVDAGGQKPLPTGQAQPIQPPSPGTQYGTAGADARIVQPATLMAGEYGQPAIRPVGGGTPRFGDADYARWRSQQITDMRYDPSREQRMYEEYMRERGLPAQGQDQPIQPPSQGGFGRDPVGMPVLKAPEVWTNPSDPDWLKNELRRKPDTRPVVWDERNKRYINNPTFVGAPGYEAFMPRASAGGSKALPTPKPGFWY